MITWPQKDPDEILDYGIVWTGRGLDEDKIIASEVIKVVGSITVVSHQVQNIAKYKDDHCTVTWLKGGIAGKTVSITIRSTTLQGRVLDETATIEISGR
jgi:hypothetical protein